VFRTGLQILRDGPGTGGECRNLDRGVQLDLRIPGSKVGIGHGLTYLSTLMMEGDVMPFATCVPGTRWTCYT
jgi:hypothetical protein